MDYRTLSAAVMYKIEKSPHVFSPYADLFDIIRAWATEDFKQAHEVNHKLLRPRVYRVLRWAAERKQFDLAEKFDGLLYRSLVFGAPYFFDDYLQAIEYGKPLNKRFYEPRRRYLRPMVEGYQDVLDGKLKLLTISMPKRAGKSQTGINFVNMLSGKFPDRSTLMEGTGDDLVKSFYKGCLEYLDPASEYHFYDIFPNSKLIGTSADLKTINLKSDKRFPTIMCRSIDARQVGLSEATNLLYLDDCVEGRSEARNRQLLDDKWEVISGDIMGRAIEGTPIVATGTRYSLYDPIGHLQEEARKHNWAWRAIEIPALDLKTDESNYEYEREGKKVFTTAYFREQREMLNPEQWESEFQQQPIEAKGLLFAADTLNYFYELPVGKEPDTIIAVCDPAENGEDYTALAVGYMYGTDVYIVDVVFNDAPPEVTKPRCAKVLMDNKASNATFESNNAGTYYARDVGTILDAQGFLCSIRTRRTVSNKQARIEFASDNIKKNFYFRAPSTYKRASEYGLFMRQVTTYVRSGKVVHDDAPDVLSLMENQVRMFISSKVEIFKRPF